MKLLNKISIWKIVQSHWLTLVNDNTKKHGFDDLLTFILLPITIASVLIWQNVILNDEAINIIITALSILVGLLFNVIVLIFDIINRDASKPMKNEFLRQILANISFSILVSIVTIVCSLITFSDHCLIKIPANWTVYFLISNFLFTVLMILKRIYALFTEEINEVEDSATKP